MKCPKCNNEMTTYHSKEYFECKKCSKVIRWGSKEDLILNHKLSEEDAERMGGK